MKMLLGILALLGTACAAAPPRTPEQAAFLEKAAYSTEAFSFTESRAKKELSRVQVSQVEFPSPYRSVDPERNDVVHAVLFTPSKPTGGAVITLGGWISDHMTPLLSRYIANESGLTVMQITLPFQGKRTPRGMPPGKLTLSADLDQSEKSFIQLFQDVNRAADWLVQNKGIDPHRIGILGTSLGGFAAASFFGMTSRFRCAAFLLAGAEVSKVLFGNNWLIAPLASELRRRGWTESKVEERLLHVSPRIWADARKKDMVLIIAAEKDEIVPLETVRELAERYGGASLIIMPEATHTQMGFLQNQFLRIKEHFQRHLDR